MVVFVNAVMPRRCDAIEATSIQGDVMPREMDIRLSAAHLFEFFRSNSHLTKMHFLDILAQHYPAFRITGAAFWALVGR